MALRRAVLAGQGLGPATFSGSIGSCQYARQSVAWLGQLDLKWTGCRSYNPFSGVDSLLRGMSVRIGSKHQNKGHIGTGSDAIRCFAKAATETQISKGMASPAATLLKADYEGKVPLDTRGERLDAFLVANIPQASRSKIQSSIKGGFVLVDGQPLLKPSFMLRGGEFVRCSLPPPPPTDAIPEDIPLDIVFEDEHLIVVNKRANMVVHPAAGHSSGTLVNALLFHCELPTLIEADDYSEELFDDIELDMFEEGSGEPSTSAPASGAGGAAPHIRPGIVHRLDKGTSGLLVVAKDERSLKGLSKQFKERTVKRSYLSILCGVPDPPMARIEAPVGRDPRDRKRQAVIEGLSVASRNRSRHAASKYRVREWLAGGACGLVEWRLETGRTHQIRVHAKHVGHPVLGDETYGCTSGLVLNWFQRTLGPPAQSKAKQLLSTLRRPQLHAKILGFVHPWTGEELLFTSQLPRDFSEVLTTLRSMNPEQ